MRRKIKHSKRYKDYPKNVPRKLLKEFFALNCKVSLLAQKRHVNSGVVSALLNDGIEPKDSAIRIRLYLSPNPICPTCHRKIIQKKTKQQEYKKLKPYYQVAWEHLSKEERHKVMETYINFKKAKVTIH